MCLTLDVTVPNFVGFTVKKSVKKLFQSVLWYFAEKWLFRVIFSWNSLQQKPIYSTIFCKVWQSPFLKSFFLFLVQKNNVRARMSLLQSLLIGWSNFSQSDCTLRPSQTGLRPVFVVFNNFFRNTQLWPKTSGWSGCLFGQNL